MTSKTLQTNQPLKKEGILLINKPKGKTSFYLIKVLRAITKIKKIGHAGTLDPFATGVMVLLVGKTYTKRSNEFLTQDKRYKATVELGFETDSYDRDGVKTEVSNQEPSFEEVDKVISSYQGDIMQTPPMFSAKKIKGKKLYELARLGQTIERTPVNVNVDIKIEKYEYPYLTLDITCSKGTYIRSLAHDIGKDLKVGGYLLELTRLRSGSFKLEDCIDFSQLNEENFDFTQHLIGQSHGSVNIFR